MPRGIKPTTKGTRPKGDRSNSYYLRRLKDEAPAIYADLLAGRVASPAEAFRMAGFKRPRTRLQELKNSWSKASIAEQRDFLRWLRATIPSHSATSVSRSVPGAAFPAGPTSMHRSAPSSGKVALSEDMRRGVMKIMEERPTTSGRIMQEMGFNKFDPSLGNALLRGMKVEFDVAEALQKWLLDNVD